MNVSILVAAISVGLMVFARLLMGMLVLAGGGAAIPAVLIPIVVAVLILWGIVTGHRLAWQWGRLLGLVGGTLLTLMAIGVFSKAGGRPGLLIVGTLLALQGVPLFPMFFALGTPEARQHFRLVCPQCGSSKPKGGNFLFTKATCKKCKTVWE
jgi:hypothetical protein